MREREGVAHAVEPPLAVERRACRRCRRRPLLSRDQHVDVGGRPVAHVVDERDLLPVEVRIAVQVPAVEEETERSAASLCLDAGREEPERDEQCEASEYAKHRCAGTLKPEQRACPANAHCGGTVARGGSTGVELHL